MRIEAVEVTPDMAKEWLAKSQRAQRGLSNSRVDRFVHAIESGQWKLTHQAIAFDSAGNIIDGQHRLAAIAKAGVAVKILAAFDVDPDVFSVIDTGAARTAANTLQIDGYGSTNLVAAAARLVLTYDLVVGTTESHHALRRLVTTQDILEFLATTRGEVMQGSVARSQQLATTLGRYGVRTFFLAFMTLLLSDPALPDTKHEFIGRVIDGSMLTPGSPILALRRWMTSETGLANIPSSDKAPTGLAVTIKSFNDYANGRERTTVYWRASEGMPRIELPGNR